MINRASVNNIKRLAAFTLAEVLITLGVIGVVAALTISTLIANADDRAVVAALKKEVSVLQQIITSTKNDYGPMDYWYKPPSGNDFSGAPAAIGNIFAQYLKIGKNCGTGSGCFPPSYTTLSWTPAPETMDLDSDTGYAKMILADGSSIAITVASGGSMNIQTMIFYVDVNGLKGPNRIGQDLFEFYAYAPIYAGPMGFKPDMIYPAGALGNSALKPSCSIYADPLDDYGFGCTAWVYYMGNLDYKYVDDLNWSTKTHK